MFDIEWSDEEQSLVAHHDIEKGEKVSVSLTDYRRWKRKYTKGLTDNQNEMGNNE